MTDFQGQNPNNVSADSDDAALLQGLPDAPGAAAAVTVAPGPGNVVALPADAIIDRVEADGRDLVIVLADGRMIVVPEGAIILPQLVVGETAIPAANLAALLLGNEPEPAAGAPQSSGGNFATDPGDIQAAFDIGNLLPYTELSRPIVEEREVIPAAKDEEPEIDIEVDDSGVSVINAEDVVDEEGLPARGNEPAGTQAASNVESTFGFINFAALDGVGSVSINGVAITAVGQVFTSSLGRLVITSIAAGRIGYDYTLTDNTITTQADLFAVTITDSDGDMATATLRIGIVDDGPIGVNDTALVPGGSLAPVSGNVLSNDISGADNFPTGGGVTSFGRNGTLIAAGGTVQGQYGTLTINANGTYTYDRAGNTPGGVSEVFNYTIVDQDGSTSAATLTVTIADAPAVITFVPEVGEGTVVREPHLPGRGVEPAGSAFDGNGETTTGTITFTSPDGVASVSIAGATITPGALPQQVSSNATGTLVVTGYTFNPDTGVGSITYTYTLADNTLDTNGTTLVFPITVTDLDGDSASDTLDIKIIDDSPQAVDDSGSQATENAAVTVNVIANDTPGADGVNLATGVALVPGSLTGAGTLVYNGNGTFTYTPAPGEEGKPQFSYTITDSDGDVATAKVIITLLPDSTPEIAIRGENIVAEAGLPARGDEAPGSDSGSNSETTTGTIPLSTGGDTVGSLVIGGVNVTAGGTVNGLHGVLTVTVSGGAYSYSYTLTDNTSGDATTDNFAVVLTDSDGDVANAAISIAIVDDEPTANADTDTIAAGEYGPATGNVITDAAAGDAGDTDTGADVLGADGAAITAISGFGGAGTVGGTTTGQYGVLTLNADGSYSYARNPGTAGGVNDVFSYTITDGDGDPATTTLTIAIADARPVTAPNETVLLDDDALAGGNPGGTGDDVDSANATGFLAGSGGDGPLTWQAVSFTSPVGFVPTLVNPGLVEVHQGATLVFTISFNTATGAYTVTQLAPISHTAGSNENNTGFSFGYRVVDQDGDSASGSIAINIDDDSPLAVNDTDSLAAGTYGPETGNVLTGAGTTSSAAGADSIGADGPAAGGAVTAVTGTAAGTIGGATAGTYGVLTLNADGSYSYVRNAGTKGGVSDVFTYTITDKDGDTATATLTIDIGDAKPLTGENLVVLLDDDALAGGNAGGTGDDADAANLTGTLSASGGDGPLSWALATTGAPAGFSYVANGTGLDVFQGATLVMQVTLNTATGAYAVTQVAPIMHVEGADENNTDFTFNYTVTDQDGDTADGTLAVNIDDDTPVAANDTDTIASGTYGPETGNVLTGAGTTSSAAGADSIGADGPAAGGAVTAVSGAVAGTIGGTTAGAYGTLTLNADGSYSYVRTAGTRGGVSDVFTYTITDSDGDSTTATLTINIEDARPVTAANGTVLLDDDALAGGNPGGTGDDVDSANATGFLAGSGGDGPLTWQAVSFTSPVGFVPTLVNPGLIEVRQGATLVFTIAFNTATGAYTVTQLAPIDHAALGDENNTGFSFGYRVVDQDGDSASGSIAINIDDDTPVVADDTDSLLAGATGPATGNVLTDADAGDAGDGDTGADSLGADGGSVTAITGFGGAGTIGGTTTGQYGTLTLNADGSYSYTRSGTAPLSATDTFTYTVTDGDGDTAQATLTITIEDAGPVTGKNVTVLLDDDALAGGNPGGTGDDADASSTSGTLAGSGGDGALAWALATTGAPAGFSYVANGTGIDVFQGATKVLAITLNTATGAYTVTQVAPIVHDAGADENNQSFSLDYTVTDADGDIANGSFSIDVDDDSPIALNDTDMVASGTYGPELGNVLTGVGTTSDAAGADSLGADGAASGGAVTAISGAAAGTIGGTTTGTYGVLTMNADGSYSYIRNVGTPAGVDDVFTYTVTDKDGDTATATLTITIEDARPVTGPNAAVQLDDDALAGGNPGGTGDDPDAVNVTGTLAGSGGDGPLVWQAVSFTSPVGFTPTLVNPGLVEVRQGATLVFTISFNTATGAYTVTQLAPISHTAGSNENNTGFSFAYRVIDQDGDTANGSIAINIDDDTPTVTSNALVQLDDDALGGNAGGAGDDVNTANAIGTLGHSFGADSAGSLAFLTTGAPAGFSYVANGTGIDVFQGATKVLTVTLNTATGAYTVVQNAPIVHDAGNDENNQAFTLNYTVTDGDGDTVTGTLDINVDDDTPIALVTSFGATVDEDGLGGGNPGGVGDAAATLPSASGSVTGLFSAGADVPLTYSLGTSTAGLPALSSGGVALTYSVVGNVLTASAGATPVFTFTLNATTGAWDFALLAPLDHATGGNENDILIDLGEMVIATDHDGDPVQAVGNLIITVDDDTPVASSDTDTVAAGTYGPETGNVITNPGTADSLGADGAAVGGPLTAISGSGGPGTIGGTTTGTYGTLTINADGGYSYVRNAGSPGGVSDVFTYTITDRDGDTATASLVINIADAQPVTAANGAVQLDDDAQAGGNPGGIGDDPDAVNVTGTLAGSGGDGPLTWTAVSLSSPGGFSASLVNPGLVEVRQGTTLVMTIAINNATGAYTVTQVAPIDHAALGDENNANFTFGYRVSDVDGDQAFGTLSINVDDDTPVVSNDTDSLLAGATGPATGNVLTDASAGDAGDGDTGADSLGADGGSVTAITGFGGAGTIGGSTTGQYGTLTLNADGSYSYTRSTSGPLSATDTFTYTVTDGDGDTATATLTITIADAGPVTGANLTVLLDDDALAGGNPGGVSDDADSANATGFLAGSGGDGALTWSAVSFSSPGGFSASLVNPGLVEVRQGTTLVMTIAINTATGAYTVTQVAPIDHTASLDENNSSFTFGYRVTDADGDQAFGSLSINIDDDTPTATNDTDALLGGAMGPAVGNVLTGVGSDGNPAGADSLGADGPATPGAVTAVASVNLPANTDNTLDGSNNLVVAGQYGTLTLNADGSYSYSRSNGAPVSGVDTFTYTITDHDGDTTTATLTITIADAGPVTGANLTVLLDDDAQAGGNPGGVGDDVDSANATGFLSGSGGDGALTWNATSFSSPGGFSASLVNPGLVEVRQGTTLVMTIAINTATGAYTVTQVAPIDHTAGLDENNSSFTFGYRVTDADGDQAFGSLSINIDDDTPVVSNDTDSLLSGAAGPATGNVLTDAAPGDAGDGDTGADSLGADGGSVTAITGFGGAGTIGGTTTGQYGTLTLNADGSYSYTRSTSGPLSATDTFTYTVTDGDGDTATATLTITIADTAPVAGANLTVLLDDDALAGGNPGGVGDDVNSANATGFLAGSGGDGALTWNATSFSSPGGFSASLVNPGLVEVRQGTTLVMTIAINNATGAYTVTQVAPIDHTAGLDENNSSFTFGYQVTDADGDQAFGTLGINVDDDTPTAVAAKAAILDNAIGITGGNFLDADNDVDNNYGADGAGKVLFTAATITSLQAQNLTSGFAALNYSISPDGTVLTATKSTDSSPVFKIELQPAGSPDQYVVTMSQKVDSAQNVDFNAGGYNFVGGNGSWAGFTQPAVANSQDVLLTPIGGGTVNTNANEGGIAGGNSVGSGESMRVDFVIDLLGSPVSGGDFYGGDDTQSFTGHYTVNGAGALFTSITTSSTVTIKAFDDADTGTLKNVGDGGADAITRIAISHGAVTTLITTSGVHVVDGISYTVTFSGGIVTVAGVADNTRIAGFTANGYNSIEFGYAGGNTFKIGDFGASVITNTAVNFTVPISIEDGDGDQAASGNLAIKLNPTTPPIVLDLDGDGVELLGTDAGVTFNYAGFTVATAWVGADDGLLAIDRNHDGAITGADELVFGTSSLTDLQGLAASHDSNADGVLDASDAAFADMGVWQDADSDGVTDAGEFRSLSELGIASISLVSDGITGTAANGDVIIAGRTVFTRTDGSTGVIADVAFRTGEMQRAEQRMAEQALGLAATMAVLAGSPASAAPAPTSDEVQVHPVPEVPAEHGFADLTVGRELATGVELPTALQGGSDEAPAPDHVRLWDWADSGAGSSSLDGGPAPEPARSEASEGGEVAAHAEPAAFDSIAITDSALMDALLMLAPQSGADHAPATDAAAVAVVVQDALGEAMIDGLLADFAGHDAPPPTDMPVRAESFEFAALLDSHVGSAEIMANIVPISDNSDESSMALSANV